MDDQLSIINTKDGSQSISSKNFNATYHSIHGAIEESIHVFISAGIYYKFLQGYSSLKIFEMGFGSGLNALLASLSAKKFKIPIFYHSIELYPLDKSVYSKLNFYNQIPNATEKEFLSLHESDWNHSISINEFFRLKKIKDDINVLPLEKNYDLIFYDAFAPSSQAYLWEEKLQSKLYHALNPNASLVTYCAQGKFKRILKSLGYQLDQLPGPGRKHEMTRANKV